MIAAMRDRHETFERLLAVWNGEADVDELDSLLAPAYLGHLGSRDRDAARLREDIVSYRTRVPGACFRAEHQFGEGDYLATRLTAATAAGGETICGLNMSRWEGGLLAEEWAIWESFGST
jgi:hypothetical protein